MTEPSPVEGPNCGTRIVPTPREMKRFRLAAGLSQREMGEILKITSSYVTDLESGERSPSATVIARYWKFRTETSKRKARRSPGGTKNPVTSQNSNKSAV
jgi:predicted transcriptional regulator